MSISLIDFLQQLTHSAVIDHRGLNDRRYPGQRLDGCAQCDCNLRIHAVDVSPHAVLMAAVFNFLGVLFL